ncbi:MAG: GntP family permease [Pirellulaceae bacterium]
MTRMREWNRTTLWLAWVVGIVATACANQDPVSGPANGAATRDQSVAEETASDVAGIPKPVSDAGPAGAGDRSAAADADREPANISRAMIILAIGIATVLALIIVFKINPFIALITAAMVVSLCAPGPLGIKIERVAIAFGEMAGKIGIVIALAAVIGKCMLDSGAADRIVRTFLRWMGERQAPAALMSSGFVLAVPVFFDTVFYLLVPLARSLHRTTGRHYLKYVLAIAAGGAITHTLVPPTPGPLVMASNLNIDIGVMIMVGAFVALFGAVAGLIYAEIADRLMPVPMRQISAEPEPDPLKDDQLPSLSLSLAPVVLPVILITCNTVLKTVVDRVAEVGPTLQTAVELSNIFGNANFALLISTAIALGTLVYQRKLTRTAMAHIVEVSLMSGGVIILITAAGGAFGSMLKEAQVGAAIESLFAGTGGAGIMLLVAGFGVAAVLKVAQGSSTAAMIVGSAMFAELATAETLGFHPVYLATAIGGGSLVGSWMNDSGFWIFTKMSGLTELEALKSWTPMLVVLGFVSFGVSLILAIFLPDAGVEIWNWLFGSGV